MRRSCTTILIDGPNSARDLRPPGARTGRRRRARRATICSRARSSELSTLGGPVVDRRALERDALARARRGDAAPADARSGHDRGGLPRALLAEDGKLFEAACLVGAGPSGPSWESSASRSGIAFQIADDILDCSGETIETGKSREPTCAKGRRRCRSSSPRARIPVVREALAGARWRAPSSGRRHGALARSREGCARVRVPRARLPDRRAALRRARGADARGGERHG
jgi:hypothetical protein